MLRRAVLQRAVRPRGARAVPVGCQRCGRGQRCGGGGCCRCGRGQARQRKSGGSSCARAAGLLSGAGRPGQRRKRIAGAAAGPATGAAAGVAAAGAAAGGHLRQRDRRGGAGRRRRRSCGGRRRCRTGRRESPASAAARRNPGSERGQQRVPGLTGPADGVGRGRRAERSAEAAPAAAIMVVANSFRVRSWFSQSLDGKSETEATELLELLK